MAQPKKPAGRKPAAPRKPAAAAATRKPAAPRKPAVKSTTEKVKATVQDRVVEPAKKAGETIKATVTGAAGATVDFGTKMIDQAEENAREAFNAMRAAAKAKDLSGVMKVQADYLKEQSARSVKQAREIGELIAQFGRDAIAPIRRG